MVILSLIMVEEEKCLIDNTVTSTTIQEDKYFQTLNKKTRNIMNIAGSSAHIVGTERARLILHMVTKIVINEVLLYPESKRSLLTVSWTRGYSPRRLPISWIWSRTPMAVYSWASSDSRCIHEEDSTRLGDQRQGLLSTDVFD